MSELKIINCKTVIPKNQYIRKEFFTKFYFKIVEETDTEYMLELEYSVDNYKLQEKINEFAVFLNYTLNPGDWIPFVTFIKDEKETLIIVIKIFSKYLPPSPCFYYGVYELDEDIINKFKLSGCLKDDYNKIYEKIKNTPFFKLKYLI